MISHNLIRQSLKKLAPALFLLLCFSIGAFAQSPSATQESTQKANEVTFNDAPLKDTISAIGNQLNLNVVFDDSMRDDKLTLELRDVTTKQVMKIILIQKKLEARIIEENTIIVYPNNATNHQRYVQYELWTAKSDANK